MKRSAGLCHSHRHERLCLYSCVQEERHALHRCDVHPSRRLFEHQHALTPGFTSRYNVKTLVWLEAHTWVVDAIQREKAIKKYPRQWKINLIEAINPNWDDISVWLFDT